MTAVVHQRMLDLSPEAINAQTTRRMLWGKLLMAAYLEFKKGAVVPPHQHENEQLAYCISGLVRLTLPDRQLLLRPGEVVLIPGGVTHSAEMPEDTVVMDFFSPPRQDWIDKTDRYWRS
jgi:quercetin dioxygenase-like cupin family protein